MFSTIHSTFTRKSGVLLAGFSSRDTVRLGLLPSDLVSQASPIPFCSTDCFQYHHVEEGSGDLGLLYMNSWNTIIG